MIKAISPTLEREVVPDKSAMAYSFWTGARLNLLFVVVNRFSNSLNFASSCV